MILASYFTYQKDPQRNIIWQRDGLDNLMPLINSCTRFGIPITIFHNGMRETIESPLVKFIKVAQSEHFSPNVYRWLVYKWFLREEWYKKIFMVDSTDVEVLNNPFELIECDRLYVGSEIDTKVDSPWMRIEQEPMLRIPDYLETIKPHMNKMLPNCGIVGGCYDIVFDFLNKITAVHMNYSKEIGRSVDMASFNYVLWKYFLDKFEYGDHINTGFKRYETTDAWFKHK